MHHDDISPWFFRGLHLFGVALILTAMIDLFTTVWPFRPTELPWRYGFLGLAAGYLQTPTLGLLLIMLGSIWEKRWGVLRTVGAATFAIGLVLLPLLGLFALDVVQMRGLQPAEAQAGVMAGGAFQTVKYFVAALVLLGLGHGAMKTARSGRRSSGGTARKPGIVASRS